jgi:hypothetical protein
LCHESWGCAVAVSRNQQSFGLEKKKEKRQRKIQRIIGLKKQYIK